MNCASFFGIKSKKSITFSEHSRNYCSKRLILQFYGTQTILFYSFFQSTTKVQKINDIYKYFGKKELHGLQNCTSMQVQFMAIIYNIILYYYNEDFIKVHSYAILQFMQFMSMENALNAFF